ncbi:DUF803-domain-containing protein [Zopfia rhizophila CBS 207.26]|uniref:DUF803-domain-containing protein n=1 Tax=Zopfia rhizophila CBS 207.26 TaxID=1314779 RepID=A0A6A6DUJ2_9PEZI|nr:DUF803-domain-containing protein [Zopfia rhizophila CBS 207.26]
MILPTSYVAAGPATTTTYNDPPTPSPTSLVPGIGSENWSSLIGIITAIVGNVMISFALNMQRYAHIRLDREWQEKERQRKRRSASYGTSQAKIAEERAKANIARKYHPLRHTEYTVENERDGAEEGYIATEADPLIPSVATHGNSRSRSRSTRTSTDTASSTDGSSEEAFKQKSYLKSPYWWAGIILMTTGEAGNFLAYGFAPASIVSPLGVVGLISNCIIAPFMLKEPFRKRDGLGVLVAVAGAVTVVASASDNNPKLGPAEIWDLITTWEFETYLGITIAVIIGLMIASNRFGERNILIDLGLVGLFGGYTALSTKGVASMLSYTLWRAITFPVTYLLVAILVFTAIMQIKYVNRALQRFDATQVIPTQFVLFTLSVILGSAILYRDFERTPSGDAGKFVGGCFMTFLGVWLITSGRPRNESEDDEDREPEGEDAINLVDGERYQDDVDGTRDSEAGTSTRCSSTIRASSPPIAINTRAPACSPSQPSTPAITLIPQATLPQTPDSSVPEAPSPLTMNPWEHERHDISGSSSPTLSPRPPPATLSRHTTLSTPIVHSEAADTPPTASTPNPELQAQTNPPLPHTPTRGASDHIVTATPVTGTGPRLRRQGTIERLGAGSRNSMQGTLLASPLSTSLSAVVAELKRGGSLRGPPVTREYGGGNGEFESSRRRESVLGIGEREVESREGEPLDRRRTNTDDALRKNRSGSLSGTLEGIWRGLRGGTGNEGDGDGDEDEQRRMQEER